MNGLLIHVPMAARSRLPWRIVARLIPNRACKPNKGKQPLKTPTASPFAHWLADPSCCHIHKSDLYSFSFFRDRSMSNMRIYDCLMT